MNCPYCQKPLHYRQKHPLSRIVAADCQYCLPVPQFTIDDKNKRIISAHICLDDPIKISNARIIWIQYSGNILRLHRVDPHGDTYVILQTNTAQDFHPSNAEAIWNRLTNLMAFS